MRTILLLAFAASAFADPTHYVCRVDATGAVVESVPTSKPSTASVGAVGPGESVVILPFVDLQGHPTIQPDAEAVALRIPVLRVVDGQLGLRQRAELKADFKAAKARAKSAERVAIRQKRIAADAIVADEPGNLEAADEVLKLKVQEEALK